MFLTEDLQKCMAFGEFIHKHAKWELTTADAVSLNRHFAWYNSLVKKVEEHILELQKVIKAPESSEKKAE